MFDIFNNDAFSVTRMTDALNEIRHVPGYIGRRGLFETSSVDTLSVAIERDKEQNVMIVPASPRGAPGTSFGKSKRSMFNLTIPHFQIDDAIYADEIQGVRQFGSETQVQMMAQKVANRAIEATSFFARTEEYHRLKMLTTGKVYDSDGTTVLLDLLAATGESLPAEIDFSFDTNTGGLLRKFCAGIHRQMASILDGLPFGGLEAICGDNFFDDLIANDEVRETYLGHAQAASLRTAYVGGSGQNDTFGEINVFGINFVNYRGTFNGSAAVNPDKCHIYPIGTPGLFRSVYAPADYMETVNTMGRRLYAKQWEMDNGKGVNLEFQSNAIHYCTRPRTLLRGKRT